MASGLNAASVWELRVTGSDTNGGHFVSSASGTDYSQQDAAQYSLTGLTSSGAGNVLLSASASADMVGNGVYCSAGTNANTAQWYQVASVIVGVSITMTTSNLGNAIATGVASGVAIAIGGALATPGLLASLMTVSGMVAWIKYSATPYTLTTATPGSGGPMTIASVASNYEGYDLARGDRTGRQPQIAWPASGLTVGSLTYLVLDSAGGAEVRVANVSLNGNNVANVGGLSMAHSGRLVAGCTVANFNGTGGVGINGPNVTSTQVSTCVTGITSSASVSQTFVTGCGTAISNTSSLVAECLVTSCTTGMSMSNAVVQRCTVDTCTTGYTGSGHVLDSVASNCGTGFVTSPSVPLMLQGCAYYNCTTPVSGTPISNEFFTTLSASPYVGGGQFAPNTTSGGGAALRDTATAVIPAQANNVDIGAVQHADPVSIGGTRIFTGF